jgi:hypothetical protein
MTSLPVADRVHVWRFSAHLDSARRNYLRGARQTVTRNDDPDVDRRFAIISTIRNVARLENSRQR